MVGYIAATLTTISFIPQVIQVVKTKDTSSISLGMYTLFVIGVAMWLVYGLVIGDLPMIISNAITTVLSSVILGYKIYAVRQNKK
ncbi:MULTISPECIES: SemiSWEET transporter [unclassified Breznakia]|uniref:SemiSWEET transporter n=1 Tax=unclassified Breznakia TaxID=2623764 RepID=UPI00247572C5|nr:MULTISPECIES: SemiSWEET transporter [unclassified Breznakia]MDH6366027.1 MtN3 and saliva related transmembrane protein [Breznakia sp. PH1-1]MDH6403041.1 MtN3 and saliva related transmembrane protein [Breznakia sp. PF1-11]MDH6410750.1 MtN3 and saliva related transmembrane protein [Breznakia sp. PFB1-11]MDH6413193.1 MtN3 and saliva related transmembrane protein [Breznakia sp. PFB1-14]MDH6415561.1 MtN3 and saliva related transmembrane protein [Breznakia sp. PFB1-4]